MSSITTQLIHIIYLPSKKKNFCVDLSLTLPVLLIFVRFLSWDTHSIFDYFVVAVVVDYYLSILTTRTYYCPSVFQNFFVFLIFIIFREKGQGIYIFKAKVTSLHSTKEELSLDKTSLVWEMNSEESSSCSFFEHVFFSEYAMF